MPKKSGHEADGPSCPQTRSARLNESRAYRRARRRRALAALALVGGLGGGMVAFGHDGLRETAAFGLTGTSAQTAPARDAAAGDAAAKARAAGVTGGADAALALHRFPRTIPASAAVGLSALRGPVTAQTTSDVALTPAMRVRLMPEYRASRATDRALLGARDGFARPCEGTHFTSGFGQRWGRLHAGVDFAGPVGQVIRAVAPGTVTVAGPASGYGRLIEIRHDDDHFTRYGHLHRVDVKVGDRVDVAQPIGALGNAGRSTGPHLHFEIRTPAGTPVDPMPWLKDRGILPADTPTK